MAVVPITQNRRPPSEPEIDQSYLMMAAAQIHKEGLAAATSLEPTTFEKLKDQEAQMEVTQGQMGDKAEVQDFSRKEMEASDKPRDPVRGPFREYTEKDRDRLGWATKVRTPDPSRMKDLPEEDRDMIRAMREDDYQVAKAKRRQE